MTVEAGRVMLRRKAINREANFLALSCNKTIWA